MKRNPKFIIRPDTGSLQLQYSNKGNWFRVNSHIKATHSIWNEDTQQLLGKDYLKDNIILSSMLKRLTDIIFDYKVKIGGKPSVEHLRNEYFKSENELSKDKSIIEYYSKWIEDKKLLIKDVRHYTTLLNNLNNFSIIKNKQFRFSDLDHEWKNQFLQYYASLNLSNTTLLKRIKCFKVFLNDMVIQKICTNTTYKEWKFTDYKTIKKTTIVCLTVKEFETLRSIEFKGLMNYYDENNNEVVVRADKLQYYADLYILGSACGLRYSDLIRLKPSNIVGNIHSENPVGIYIVTDIEKTDDERVRIPLNNISNGILEKYNYTIKYRSNQKINDNLKLIFRILKFNDIITYKVRYGNKTLTYNVQKWRLLTMHSSRKTFITHCISNGITVDNIMKWSNHKDLKVFYDYVSMGMAEEEQMQKLFS
jgi:integrase